MKTVKFKDVASLVITFLAVVFFFYTWLSLDYNNENYDYLKNNFGQFTAFGFLMFFVYRFLKFLGKEKLYLTVIIASFIAIVVVYLFAKIFLWPFAIVLAISLFFFLTRKWLVYKGVPRQS